jgi:hypothetical protein
VIRDVITSTQPMILSGQVYATVALLGSLSYATMRYLGVHEVAAELVACTAAFALRASAIVFDIRMGPPGSLSGSARAPTIQITSSRVDGRNESGGTAAMTQKVRRCAPLQEMTVESQRQVRQTAPADNAFPFL